MWKISGLFPLLLVAAVPGPVAAGPGSDAAGSADHPIVSRYEGSFIDGYEVKSFDEFVLPLGPAVRRQGNSAKVPEEQAALQGRITRILYRGPKGRSTLEILKNYQSALESAGFETLFACGADCGNNFHVLLYGPMETRIRSSRTASSAFDLPQDMRYLAARLSDDTRTVHVAILAAFDNGFSDLSKQPVTLLQVVETGKMETGKVTVDAAAIGKGIDTEGHMAIYVQFDTGSATIKSASGPVLGEVASLLQQRPDLKLLVVGHTDNQGTYEYNINLSSQRANAVAEHLTNVHGISAGRLRAAGVGYLAPIASNETADGRAKNRRVELVRK